MKRLNIFFIFILLSVVCVTAMSMDTDVSTHYIEDVGFVLDLHDLGTIGDGVLGVTATRNNNSWLEFDGENDKVTVPNSSSFGDGLSVLVWYNTPEFDNWERIIGNDNFFTLNADDSKQVGLKVVNDTAFKSVQNDVSCEDDDWCFFSGTSDDGNMKAYLNGVYESGTDYGAMGQLNNTNNNWNIGGDITGHWYEGLFEDLKVYNKSLSPIQIARIYNESYLGSNFGRSIPVLSYHQVRNTEGYDTIVNIGNFTEQMQFLNDTGYTTITRLDYYNWRQGTYALPERPIILEFDDGFYNIYANAFPIMETFDFVGVVPFIVEYAGVDAGEDYGFMTWAEINNLSNAGWEIAGHGATNYNSGMDVTQRASNWTWVKSEITSNVGITPTHFVYPFLDNNDSIDDECATYFQSCEGNNGDGFLFETASLTHSEGSELPSMRYIVHNSTRLAGFKDFSDYYDGLIYDFGFNAVDSVTIYDKQSGLNGTRVGASWDVDGTFVSLVEGKDFSLSGLDNRIFTLENSELAYTDFLLSSFQYDGGTSGGSSSGGGTYGTPPVLPEVEGDWSNLLNFGDAFNEFINNAVDIVSEDTNDVLDLIDDGKIVDDPSIDNKPKILEPVPFFIAFILLFVLVSFLGGRKKR